MNRFDLVIFDLDGTLLDTISDIAACANAVLRNRGWAVHDTDAYKYLCGYGVNILFTKALPEEAREQHTVSECVEEFLSLYREHWDKETIAYPGIPALLDYLSTKGIKKAVLSNKPDDATKLCVSKLLSGWSFDFVYGERRGIPPKPNPEAALEIAKSLHIAPERCMFVGDTATDMQTAVNAGMYPVGVLWGFRQKPELEQAGAEKIVNEPSELLSIL